MTPTFGEALRFWLRLGFISFGGPAGQIAILRSELVDRRGWIDAEAFQRALSFCMLLPGPEATQLAVWCGWRMHGARGGLAAGTLFILPAAVILWLLSGVYAAWGTLPALAAVFHGLQAAVVAVVGVSLWRMGRRALRHPAQWALAAAAFGLLFGAGAPFPLIVLGAGALGFAFGPLRPTWFGWRPIPPPMPQPAAPGWGRVLLIGLGVWMGPVLVAAAWRGADDLLVQIGIFFGQAALVTFGGAYAVLPYVAQRAAGDLGWLTQSQMIAGLALAETTPGPLIMVLQFVGFMAGWNHPNGLPPGLAGTLGAAMATWTTFVPSFIFIFLGGPRIERLSGAGRFGAALAAITAAVVGVIANLAVWLAARTLLPDGRVPDLAAVAVALGAGVALWRGQSLTVVVAGSAAAGLIIGLLR